MSFDEGFSVQAFGGGTFGVSDEFNAADYPGLEQWCDTSLPTSITITGANKVTDWYDRSGNDNHWAQTTDSLRPILGADGSITFDGTQLMECTPYALDMGAATTYIVADVTAMTANIGYFIGTGARGYFFNFGGSSEVGSRSNAIMSTLTSVIGAGKSVVAIKSNKILINGVEVSLDPSFPGPQTGSQNIQYLHYVATGTNTTNSTYEEITYTQDHSDLMMQQISTELKRKWNI